MKTASTKNFLRVGITGGIGSGKSTVCAQFSSRGRTVLCADEIGRHLTDTDDQIKTAIRNRFGDGVFLQNGLVDRKALAAIVFNNKSLRQKLDAIIHPVVFKAVESSIANLSLAQKSPYLLVEAALIFESGMDKKLDYVIVVNADEERRIKRVVDRDHVSRDSVIARMRSQMDVDQKLKLADFVIDNDGSEQELQRRVEFLDTLLSRMCTA